MFLYTNDPDAFDNESCMCDAFLCSHQGFTSKIGCARESNMICIRHAFCCMPHRASLGVGCTGDPTNGDICKIGLHCCEWGLYSPTFDPLCSSVESTLCIYSVCSFPLHPDYVKYIVFSKCGWQCLPRCYCCGPALKSDAFDRMLGRGSGIPAERIVDRGDDTDLAMSKIGGTTYRDDVIPEGREII